MVLLEGAAYPFQNMDYACSVAGLCEQMRHPCRRCAVLGVEDEPLSRSKITNQLLDWPGDK